MPIIEGQELVDQMTRRLKDKIPEELYDKMMCDMQRDGNCGVYTCCLLCVEHLVEFYENHREESE